jgi:hypothetical protein
MAINVDGPRGLTLIGRAGGGEAHSELYYIDGDVATAVFKGDPVSKSTDGGTGPEDLKRCDVMTAASDDFLGAVLGLHDSNMKPVAYLAASTAGYALVCDDENAEYRIQTADGGTALTAAAVGDQADLVFTHAGNTATGQSGVELSQTLAGDGNNAQLSIRRRWEDPKNVWGEDWVKVVVVPAEHAYKSKQAAI